MKLSKKRSPVKRSPVKRSRGKQSPVKRSRGKQSPVKRSRGKQSPYVKLYRKRYFGIFDNIKNAATNVSRIATFIPGPTGNFLKSGANLVGKHAGKVGDTLTNINNKVGEVKAALNPP